MPNLGMLNGNVDSRVSFNITQFSIQHSAFGLLICRHEKRAPACAGALGSRGSSGSELHAERHPVGARELVVVHAGAGAEGAALLPVNALDRNLGEGIELLEKLDARIAVDLSRLVE